MNVSAQILRSLRGETSSVSDLGKKCGVSTETIRHQITELEAAGFLIQQHPIFGYSLVSCPDRLIADDIASRLSTDWVKGIVVFERTSSTNDRAMELGTAGGEGPSVVLAETQSAGRGRFGRAWSSPPREGIWFSLMLRPSLPIEHWTRLPGAAALAVAHALEETGVRHVGVKWPNDLQIETRKVAGILVETGSHRKKGAFAVIGIGINANQSEFPAELTTKATSIKQVLGVAIDRNALAAKLIFNLQTSLTSAANHHAEVIQELRERSTLLGKPVRFETPTQKITEGFAVDLDDEGRLVFQTHTGGLQTLNMGEVSLSPFS
jgi:BirA family biotin operon repressor/biotin-[acetyl-CoA-carboxylase] ligase